MDKKLLAAVSLALPTLVLPFSASADIIGATFGAYQWNQDWSGDLKSGSIGTNIDLQDDLGYGDDNGTSFFVALEHPIPLLPNIRLAHTKLEMDETNALSRQIVFDGKTYNASTTVSSDVDLTHTDVTLYYEILDNIPIVSLDVGLTARIFDGSAEISDNSQSASTDVDGALPLVYVNARVDLPLTGLYVGAEANAIAYSGDSITDLKANIGYEVGIVGFELGYRSFDIDIDDSDDEFNLTVEGGYLGIVVDI